MKKLLMTMLAAPFAFFIISCDDDEVVSESSLPQAAKDFVVLHFPDQTITKVVKDKRGNVEYEVRLDNGFSLEFGEDGAWKEVEGYGLEMPASFLAEIPDNAIAYIETNHETLVITKIELGRDVYVVELTGDIEIVFDSSGTFVRYDD